LQSKLQKCVVLSYTKAKYIVVTKASKEFALMDAKILTIIWIIIRKINFTL